MYALVRQVFANSSGGMALCDQERCSCRPLFSQAGRLTLPTVTIRYKGWMDSTAVRFPVTCHSPTKIDQSGPTQSLVGKI